jgi:hypothetical protein
MLFAGPGENEGSRLSERQVSDQSRSIRASLNKNWLNEKNRPIPEVQNLSLEDPKVLEVTVPRPDSGRRLPPLSTKFGIWSYTFSGRSFVLITQPDMYSK